MAEMPGGPEYIFTLIDASDLDRIEGDLTAIIASLIPAQLQYVASVWQAAVSGLVLPGMRKAIHDARYAMLIGDTSAMEYPYNGDPFRGRIVMLDGGLARRYEDGYKSFDMKPGLLAGPHARTAKDGSRYNIIPFSHSTPGSVGQKGAPMPTEIYALARRLQARQNLKLPPGLQGYGQRSKIPAQVNAQAIQRGHGGPMFSPYTWRGSPYSGMQKTGGPGQTSYRTFRVVSSKSDPSSWIHPGQAANPVINSVQQLVMPHILAAIKLALGANP
jgi:hypothetical protein